ncbi:MAG: molybdate ABC transporter substrate-binding protein [Bacillota bacterium]
MKLKLFFMINILLFIALAGCGQEQVESDEPIELTISAAASLNEVLTEIKTLYEEEHQQINLLLNFGGSGSLQQQIIQGAPVDLFFSAAEDKYDELLERNLIDSSYSSDLLGNELVLVTPSNTSVEITDFPDLVSDEINTIAIGTPETVPAGQYAKQTLQQLYLWEKLSAKLIPSKDVRQVLSYVETGNVDAGIVYRTDALLSDKVTLIKTADPSLHDPIIFPVGIVKGTRHKAEAIDFYEFLHSEKATKVFNKYGFLMVGNK